MAETGIRNFYRYWARMINGDDWSRIAVPATSPLTKVRVA